MQVKLLELKGLPLYLSVVIAGFVFLVSDAPAIPLIYFRMAFHLVGVLIFASAIFPLLKGEKKPEAWPLRLVISLFTITISLFWGNVSPIVFLGSRYAELALVLVSLAIVGQVFWMIGQTMVKFSALFAVFVFGGSCLFASFIPLQTAAMGGFLVFSVLMYVLFVIVWALYSIMTWHMDDSYGSW